jgi:glycopeptide antibiotics resistance protein
MTFKRRILPWFVVGLVGAALTAIALGHTGDIDAKHKFSLIPFITYGEPIVCLVRGCESISRALVFLIFNGLGNIVVFMPLGGALYIALRHSDHHPHKRILLVGLLGAGVSLAYEIIQIWIPGRVVATDDIITNTLGTLLGAWLGQRGLLLWREHRPVRGNT